MERDCFSLGGEFSSRERERDYRADYLAEGARHVRRAFLCAFAINVIFYINDWSMEGRPGFLSGLAARTVIVVLSLLCALRARHIAQPRDLDRLCLLWSVPVIPACAVLVMPHTESALFITFVLPNIFYLLFPTSFATTLATGIACSVVVGAGYILPAPLTETSFGLLLGMTTINVVLILVVIRGNRLRRSEWAAARAERQANRALTAHQGMLDAILRAVPTPLLITTRDGAVLIRANDAARGILGEEAVKSWTGLAGMLGWRDATRLSVTLELDGQAAEFETRLRVPGGASRDVLLKATVTDVGGTETLVIVIVDISTRKEMETRLEHQANTDPLTGLANRTSFFAAAEREVRRAERYARPLAVVMVDIDFFKQINDAHGHEGGDQALKAFARLCRSLLRDQDVVARLGGEEFGLLLPESDPASAFALAERLREAVAALSLAPLPVRMTISAGVAALHPGEDAVDPALSRADRALYAAKGGGRNRVLHSDVPDLGATLAGLDG